MDKIIISAILLVFILINGCDNTIEPIPSVTSGEITITNEIVDQKHSGFAFSEGRNILFPNSQNFFPDIIVLVNTDENGNAIGVFFRCGGNLKPSFKLVESFNISDSAEVFFNNLKEVPDSNYLDLAITVEINQIWAVKSVDNKFGTIQILNIDAYNYGSNQGSTLLYGEATFKWKYQSNGTRNF